MKKKILIIGADSFIAKIFIRSINDKANIIGYSRRNIDYCDCVLSEDFFDVKNSHYETSEIVINFAAIVHQEKLKNDNLYEKINTELPIHLALKAKETGVKQFIQMSTIAVYGNTSFIDINNVENPISVYGKTKYNADKALLNLRDGQFKVSIVRPPMVYGGGEAPGNMAKLIKLAQKGIPLPFKNVNNKRDFVHVSNLVYALKNIIEREIDGISIPTDKNPVSTEEIIMFIKKYSSERIRLINIPKLAHFFLRKILPHTYNKVFGNLLVRCNLPSNIYKPQFKVEEGIKEMIGNYK